jgi:outer membrane protein assembly factor BamA
MTKMWRAGKYYFVLAFTLSCRLGYGQAVVTDSALGTSTNTLRTEPAEPSSEAGHSFVIGEIFISGNRRTKSYIIERELSFKRGDSVFLSDLVKAFERSRDQVINTHLFNEVIISLKEFRGFIADIQIDVKERWYVFPVPYVRPVDRNLTAWAEKNYSLGRVDYGLKYSHYNFTGRNDYLRAWLITGYSRRIELAYDQPYADKTLMHGFGLGMSYSAFKELDVHTVNNQQQFINSDTISYAGKYLREQLTFSLRYYYRPGIKTRHFVRLSFNNITLDSAVTVWNPSYFNNGKRQVFYPEISYVLNYNNVDYTPYPLQGFLFETGILHRGINADMNLWQIYVKSTEALKIGRKTYFVTQNIGTLKLPLDQPFYNQQLFGYGDFYMRGLEKYVIDGIAGGLARNTLLLELFNFSIPFLRGTSHDRIPFHILAKTYVDCGYVYNRNYSTNSLENRILYSGGVGIDIVTFYDLVLRFEYSIDQFGGKGLFFHIKNDF